jgi:hypothetical protein
MKPSTSLVLLVLCAFLVNEAFSQNDTNITTVTTPSTTTPKSDASSLTLVNGALLLVVSVVFAHFFQ